LIYNPYFGFYFSHFFFFLFLEFRLSLKEGGEGYWLLGRATLLKGATPFIIISIVRIIIVVTDLFSANNCYFVFIEF
jgi:hypothetical protein